MKTSLKNHFEKEADDDALANSEYAEWRWYSGFFIYGVLLFLPPLVGFVSFNILDIRDSNENASS